MNSPGKENKNITMATVYILMQSVVYGIGDVVSKTAYGTMSVYTFLTIRYIIAFAAIMMIAGKTIINGIKHVNLRYRFLPVMCTALARVIENAALSMTEATRVSFIRSLPTVVAPLLALVFYKKKYKLFHIPVQIIVVIGFYLLCDIWKGFSLGKGELVALISVFFFAGALVFGENSLSHIDVMTLTALQVIGSEIAALAGAVIIDRGFIMSGITLPNILTIVYMAVACTVGGYFLQNMALKKVSSGLVAMLQSTAPIMTAVFSFLLINERLSPTELAGAAIILIAVSADTFLDSKQ